MSTFGVDVGWEHAPDGIIHGDVADVAVDEDDLVYLLTRRDSQILVYDRAGGFVRSWGNGEISAQPHGITVANGVVFCVDEMSQVIRKYTKEGHLFGVIGRQGVASETGVSSDLVSLYDISTSIKRGGPPFNRPTSLAVAPNGELFVSDGYGNARIHRFNAEGELIASWGEPGSGPGQFRLPHYVHITRELQLLVCDRENERIQLFTLKGGFIDQWTDLQRPMATVQDSDGLIYVAEGGWKTGEISFKRGKFTRPVPPRLSVLDSNGNVIERIGNHGSDPCADGNLVAPHGLCLDSHGDLYLAEVTWSWVGDVPAGCHSMQKFVRL